MKVWSALELPVTLMFRVPELVMEPFGIRDVSSLAAQTVVGCDTPLTVSRVVPETNPVPLTVIPTPGPPDVWTFARVG